MNEFTCILILALAYLRISTAAYSGSPKNHDQQLLSTGTNSIDTRNFSVGISLQDSYGTAAIIFEGSDGELTTHTRVYHGSHEFRRIMTKLSLESSRHVAPPYESDEQYWADQPRKAARLALKMVGLPASYEVGVLAEVIQSLRSQLESQFNIAITEAVFTSLHLLALYQDDLEDAALYAGIKYVIPKNQFKPILWETGAAYAGHGLGLCEHWQDEIKCLEEERELPKKTFLAVHYGRAALTSSLAIVSHAATVWEPDYRHIANFTLGSDAIKDYASTNDYWANVREALLSIMIEYPLFDRPEEILLTGDMVQGDFLEFTAKTMAEYLGFVPPMLAADPVVVSAWGAAEFMRRGPAPWSV